MSAEIEDMISMASAMFPENVMRIMQRAEFCKEDINALTREDVDHEFREFRFGIRKSLWMFLRSFKTDTSNQQQANEYLALTSQQSDQTHSIILHPVKEIQEEDAADASQNTEKYSPASFKQTNQLDDEIQEWDIGEIQDVVTTPTPTDTTPAKNKKRPSRPQKNTSPRSNRRKRRYGRHTAGGQLAPYPCNIQSPFPLNDDMKNYLVATPYMHINEHKAMYNQLVREVYRVLERHSDDTPGLDEIDGTARNLCEEYSCLFNNGSHTTLYTSLRKKRNNTQSWRRSVAKESSFVNEQEYPLESSLHEQNQPDLSRLPPYPLGIPTPFPLNATLSKLLRSETDVSRKYFRRTYYDVVKAVIQVIELKLGGKATLKTMSAVAQNLCVEYPILAKGNSSKKGRDFYYSLRKCSNYRAQQARVSSHTKKDENGDTEDIMNKNGKTQSRSKRKCRY